MTTLPKTTAEAITTVINLTGICEQSLRTVLEAKTESQRTARVARTAELCETRTRIIERFGLQEFAAGLVG